MNRTDSAGAALHGPVRGDQRLPSPGQGQETPPTAWPTECRLREAVTVDDALASWMADRYLLEQLRDLRRRGRHRARRWTSREALRGSGGLFGGCCSTVTSILDTIIDLPTPHRLRAVVAPLRHRFKASIADANEERLDGSRTSRWPRSTTCSMHSARLGRGHRPEGRLGRVSQRRRHRARRAHPGRPAGGLAVGEAVPAQAIAEVCEIDQLRGQVMVRQVEGVIAGSTANQGLSPRPRGAARPRPVRSASPGFNRVRGPGDGGLEVDVELEPPRFR